LGSEISSIRQSIRTKGTIIPQEKIIFILFAPPEYPTINAAEYLSSKIQFPVIYPHEYRVENHHLLRRQDSSSSQMNMTTRTLLRQSSSAQDEKDTRTRLMERIYATPVSDSPSPPLSPSGDCENGFILYEYPDTITEMKYFKEQIVPGYRVELIFLQLTNETMRALQYKFDRWVHPPSRRSYHMIYSPPKTIAVDLLPPSAENMIDDVTGEALVQEPNDLPETYKERLFQYQIREIPMFFEFQECAHEVPGGISQDDVHK
jgi:adenylate kinase family enzyme